MDGSLLDHYDTVIVGTSLTETIVAAALARIGKSVLHLDRGTVYGSVTGSYNLSELSTLLTQQQTLGDKAFLKNIVIGDINDGSEDPPDYLSGPLARKFTIDLSPKFLWSSSDFIDTLIRSGVSRYLEFRVLQRCYMLVDNSLVAVPASKGDIFKSKAVNLKEKRQLMKFLGSLSQPSEADQILIQEHDSFESYLVARGLTANLRNFVVNSLAMIPTQQSEDDSISTAEGLQQTGRFLTSLARYGSTPFLVPLYGTGELAQAFCRLAAVYGATYCLSIAPSSISVAEVEGETSSRVSGITVDKDITCDHFVCNADHAEQKYITGTSATLSRAVLITAASLNDDKIFMATIPAGSKYGNEHSITLFQTDESLSTCPPGCYIVHITTTASSPTSTAYDDLSPFIEDFFSVPKTEKGEEIEEKGGETEETTPESEASGLPHVIWSLYFNQISRTASSNLPVNMHVAAEVDSSISLDAALVEAAAIFSSICPEEEFIPLVPNPEDIIYETYAEDEEETEDDEKER
eukprot:TRINITY_DN4417_c0_g1_i1.p1 TRINITY_DN4417_c0_g1~~TRINITY_DN4417_c0_g1_i1.p1  ORF type:complete len:521 (-),score=110.62 TRINITY_DN4417_c0_g1_i1:98-1660(-)